MVFKGFKKRSNKRYLNKLISQRSVNVGDTKVKSLGVILCFDEVDDIELFRGLAAHLRIRPNKLKVIAFSSNGKEKANAWDLCFNPNDFGWNGTIKNVELKSFLDTEFDVLISYYTEELLELKLLTALSKSQFKVGILQTDKRLNDLIIKTDITEFNVFKEELYKYLTILNKIKNE
ncbi:DUF6913 domain-containing protein [Snuella sedimenti]|uniref:Uncharacterized protein n=1 Tax=Snuella sedimenti TaxID=2798802 RepID=A0A8J7LT13_9FLAO|nr:hypothetical protein [Snuella sedimenti]MBJ6369015.1 hypothetical protein [Snuella sedimenti]